ncbi:MAG: hypothetical protein HQL49_06640 [Gammaproteobacteria bacterium]|nr:hypothetical protein [Gammaproteobacteria bacterium]
MNWIGRVKNAFELPPEPCLPDLSTDESRLSDDIVVRYSRGNVLLQLGQYVTKDELDSRIEKLKGYRFSLK